MPIVIRLSRWPTADLTSRHAHKPAAVVWQRPQWWLGRFASALAALFAADADATRLLPVGYRRVGQLGGWREVDAVGDLLAVLALLGTPAVAIAWPIATLALGGHTSWHPWGVGGCLVIALFMIPLGTYILGDLPHDDSAVAFAIGTPVWLLGSLNAVAAVTFWVMFYSQWSLRLLLAIPAMIVALSWAGTVAVTWHGLPDPAAPGDGQLTGVVGERTQYGWRQVSRSSFELAVAVPATSFEDFLALDIRDHAGGRMGKPPPLHHLTIFRDGLAEVAGIGFGIVEHDGAFTIDGLTPQVDYWFCVGSAPPRPDVWTFDVCDIPDVTIPGQLRVAYSPHGSRIAQWP